MIKSISRCNPVVLYGKWLNEACERVRNLLWIIHLPQALIYLRKQVTGMLGIGRQRRCLQTEGDEKEREKDQVRKYEERKTGNRRWGKKYQSSRKQICDFTQATQPVAGGMLARCCLYILYRFTYNTHGSSSVSLFWELFSSLLHIERLINRCKHFFNFLHTGRCKWDGTQHKNWP